MRWSTALSAVAWAGLCACVVTTPGTRVEPSRIRAIACWLDLWVEREGLSGSVLVADHGQVILARAYGLADLENGVANTTASRHDIGSIAKPLLATVVLRLVEAGELALDDAVAGHVPELAGKPAGAATLRQLLTHSGGWIDHGDVPGYFEKVTSPALTRADVLAMFADREPLFPPGEGHAYSNFGYTALALACENATGRPYPELLNALVLEPAGMTETCWNDQGAVIEGRSAGYLMDLQSGLRRADRMNSIGDLGSGDVLSTPRDLWRFQRALFAGELVSRTGLELMLTPVHLDQERGRGTGMGWELVPLAGGGYAPGHGSLAFGHVGVIEALPGRGAFLAVLVNVRPTDDVLNNIPPPDVRRIQAGLRALLLGEEPETPRTCLARVLLDLAWDEPVDTALERIDDLRRSSPDTWRFDPDAFMLAGYYLVERDDVAGAIQLARYALESAPAAWVLWEALGDFQTEAGEREAALEAYRRALELQPQRDYLRDRVSSLEAESGA